MPPYRHFFAFFDIFRSFHSSMMFSACTPCVPLFCHAFTPCRHVCLLRHYCCLMRADSISAMPLLLLPPLLLALLPRLSSLTLPFRRLPVAIDTAHVLSSFFFFFFRHACVGRHARRRCDMMYFFHVVLFRYARCRFSLPPMRCFLARYYAAIALARVPIGAICAICRGAPCHFAQRCCHFARYADDADMSCHMSFRCPPSHFERHAIG